MYLDCVKIFKPKSRFPDLNHAAVLIFWTVLCSHWNSTSTNKNLRHEVKVILWTGCQTLVALYRCTTLTRRHFFHSCFDKSETSPWSTPRVLLRTVGKDMVCREQKRFRNQKMINPFLTLINCGTLRGACLRFLIVFSAFAGKQQTRSSAKRQRGRGPANVQAFSNLVPAVQQCLFNTRPFIRPMINN